MRFFTTYLKKKFERKFFGFLWLPKCISDYNLILLKKYTPTQQQLHCWDNKQFMRSILNICNLFHFNAKSEFIVWTGDCKKKLSNQNNFLLKVKIPSSYFFAKIIFFCKGPVDYFLNQMIPPEIIYLWLFTTLNLKEKYCFTTET